MCSRGKLMLQLLSQQLEKENPYNSTDNNNNSSLTIIETENYSADTPVVLIHNDDDLNNIVEPVDSDTILPPATIISNDNAVTETSLVRENQSNFVVLEPSINFEDNLKTETGKTIIDVYEKDHPEVLNDFNIDKECDRVLSWIHNQTENSFEEGCEEEIMYSNNNFEEGAAESTPDDDVFAEKNNINNNVDNAEERRGKKKLLHKEKWKKEIMKANRNRGASYVNTKGKIVPEKRILSPCGDKCIFKCISKIKEDDRKILFSNYWKIGNLHEQRHFLLSCMRQIRSKRNKENESGRNPNNEYYFHINGEKIRVCKLFFLNTLGISNRSIRTVLAKTKNGVLESDNRGKHKNHIKVDESIRTGIIEHIKSIPRIESHYLRAQTTREYIEGGKTIADLHRDYVALCKENEKPYGNYTMYFRIFNENFNISFFVPKKDLCNLCEQFKNSSVEEKAKLKSVYEKHVTEKTLSRANKDKDKTEAKKQNIILACFDLQAVLQTPCGDVNSFYYKSRLATYNLTIYDIGNQTGHCYVWHEGEAARGVNEVGTCIYNFIQELEHHEKPIVFYADNCSGQNKNKFMTSLLMNCVMEFNVPSITLNFLTVGHTQNEGDAMHSLIEKQKKRALKSGPIYVPAQWVAVIKNSKKNGEPFRVTELDYDKFFDLKHLQTQIGNNFQCNTDGDKISWHDIATIKVDKNEPFTFKYKTSYSEPNFKKCIPSKKALSKNKFTLKQLYREPAKIAAKKYNSLMELCQKNHILKKYQEFYFNLKHDGQKNESGSSEIRPAKAKKPNSKSKN